MTTNTTARAEIEPYAGAIRVWAGDSRYGDPYVWCGTIRWRSKDEAEIGPYDRKVTMSFWKAIMRACQEAGIKRILARTYPEGADGPVRERWITVK